MTMERRKITIERNVIENVLMAAKDFVKRNRKVVLYSALGICLIMVLVLSAYVYFERKAAAEIVKFERIMDRYRALERQEDGGNTGVFIVIEEMKNLVNSSSWGFVHTMGDYVLGRMYFGNKSYSDARRHYLKFADDNPGSDFAVLALQKAAVAAESQGFFEEALQTYRKLDERFGDTPYADQISYDLARMYQKKGDIYKAKEYYHKVISSHPRSVFSAKSSHRLFLLTHQAKNVK